MRKFIIYVLSPILTFLLGYLKFSPPSNNDDPIFYNIAGWFTLIGSVFIYYVTMWSPSKLYDKSKNRKWDAMKELAKKLNADYNNEYNFGVNVMLVHRRILFRLEPSEKDPNKLKKSWFKKRLKVAREFGVEGADPVHPRLRLSINQGVCGDAFRNGRETSAKYVKGAVLLEELLPADNFNLNRFQMDMTKGLVIVVSCPLIINDKDGDQQKIKKIGVINVESKVDTSSILLTDETNMSIFFEKVVFLGKIFNTLHV